MASKGQTLTVTYVAWDTVNNAGKTGDVANHTLRWIKDGVSAAPSNSPAQIDATNAPGVYSLALTAAECGCNLGTLSGKSSTAGIVIIPITITFEQLPTAAPAAAGGLPTVDGSNKVAGILDKAGFALTGDYDPAKSAASQSSLNSHETARANMQIALVAEHDASQVALDQIYLLLDTEINVIITSLNTIVQDLGDPSADATTLYAQLLTIKAYVDELESRLTALRAGYLDNLSGGAAALEATAQAIKAKTDTISWADILRIQGLVLDNHYEHTVVRDANGNKISSVMDAYDSAANAQTHDGVTGLIESYVVTATYTNNKMTSFLSKRVP